MKSILLLEDDENLNRGISLKLSKEGYHVFSAFSLKEAKVIWNKENIAMVICDITLPDGNGLSFGKLVRETSDSLLVYLTALDQESDVVNGYDTGADDYITKPFSVNILVSKINALMRRLGEQKVTLLISGEIEVHLQELQVYKNNTLIMLSKTEILLLIYLLENAGQILSKDRILDFIIITKRQKRNCRFIMISKNMV